MTCVRKTIVFVEEHHIILCSGDDDLFNIITLSEKLSIKIYLNLFKPYVFKSIVFSFS